MTDQAVAPSATQARDDAERAIERRTTRPERNVWTFLVPDDELRDHADAIDARAATGHDLPLRGVSVAVKDNIDVAGVPTTAGCEEFSYTPDLSSPVVQRMVDAGALIIGKTNLDQFATGLVGTRSPDFGICRNPIDPAFIAGGSSSGSAVAVATGMVPVALGTDTAGSGRVPAAACGIVGLKPTRDVLSTRGVVPASRTFDCISLFTPSCGVAAQAFGVVSDAGGVWADGAGTPWTTVPTRWRIGVPQQLEWFGDADGPSCFDRALADLSATGAELVPIDLEPFRDAGRLLYDSALVADRAAAFGGFAAAHPEAMDPTVLAIVTAACGHDATAVFDALDRLEQHRRHTAPTWGAVDAIVTPTMARHPRVDEVLADPFGPNTELGTYTSFVNVLDLCALAIPVGVRSNGLPFGLSLVAPAYRDHALLALGAQLNEEVEIAGPARARLAVVGAHLSGMPLNHQLLELGARLVSSTHTAPEYRLFDLGTTPARPGMVREGSGGAAIAVEVWELDTAALGMFLPRVPAPLAIGTVELADGSSVLGFLCEPHALEGARDITEFGGWRAYRSG